MNAARSAAEIATVIREDLVLIVSSRSADSRHDDSMIDL
jgi:hypothetical protein